MAVVTKRKGSGIADVSPLVLELHAKKLGMGVQELIDVLNKMEGKNTAEKLRKLYEERRSSRGRTAQMVPLFALGPRVAEVPGKPGRYRARGIVLVPGEEDVSERLQWATIFADQATMGRIQAAPLGAQVEGFLNYSEDFSNWTLTAFRVHEPSVESLDLVCDPAESVNWSEVGQGSFVFLKLDPSKGDVDPTIRETRDGSPVVRVAYPIQGGAILDIWIFDVGHLNVSDPWAEFKSLPAVYISGKLRSVRNGVYTISAPKVYAPKAVEQKSLADRMEEYFQRKGKNEASPRAVARALSVPEGDVIVAAKEDPRFDYSEEDDLVVYKG